LILKKIYSKSHRRNEFTLAWQSCAAGTSRWGGSASGAGSHFKKQQVVATGDMSSSDKPPIRVALVYSFKYRYATRHAIATMESVLEELGWERYLGLWLAPQGRPDVVEQVVERCRGDRKLGRKRLQV
jgi:hypothetical protein